MKYPDLGIFWASTVNVLYMASLFETILLYFIFKVRYS
jgi:hypothetical protein